MAEADERELVLKLCIVYDAVILLCYMERGLMHCTHRRDLCMYSWTRTFGQKSKLVPIC